MKRPAANSAATTVAAKRLASESTGGGAAAGAAVGLGPAEESAEAAGPDPAEEQLVAEVVAARPAPEAKLFTLRLVRGTAQSYIQYKEPGNAEQWRLLVSITEKQCAHHMSLLRRLMARVMPGQDTWMSCTWTCALQFQSAEALKQEFASRKNSWLQHIWAQERAGQPLGKTDIWPPPYPVVRRWPPSADPEL